jgi:hypothetical protein
MLVFPEICSIDTGVRANNLVVLSIEPSANVVSFACMSSFGYVE